MFHAITKRSKRVYYLKRIVIAVGSLTIAAIFVFPMLKSVNNKMNYEQNPTSSQLVLAPASKELTKVEAPKFFGKDEKDQPYTITARTGIEKTKGLMELEEIWADLKMQDDTYLILTSNHADIHVNQHQLDLQGNVIITTDKGYVINTPSAIVHYKEKSVIGDQPVNVSGDRGTIDAPSFKITPDMKEIIFHGGRVHTTLYNKSK